MIRTAHTRHWFRWGAPMVLFCAWATWMSGPSGAQRERPRRFVIDAHQHWRNEPGYVAALVSTYPPRNAMACVLTPRASLDAVRQAAAEHPDVIIPYGSIDVDTRRPSPRSRPSQRPASEASRCTGRRTTGTTSATSQSTSGCRIWALSPCSTRGSCRDARRSPSDRRWRGCGPPSSTRSPDRSPGFGFTARTWATPGTMRRPRRLAGRRTCISI